jgi:hypothetical protein
MQHSSLTALSSDYSRYRPQCSSATRNPWLIGMRPDHPPTCLSVQAAASEQLDKVASIPNKTVEIRAMMSARVRIAKGISPMVMRQIAISAGALVVAIAVQGNSANALSMQECSAKYNAAKEAGTLAGMKWNDFRKAQCGANATAAPTPSTTPPAPAAQPPKATAARPSPAPTPAATGNAVFPNAVSPKYSGESAGKARMQSCLDQYRANKANGGNGGLKWIEKGGGYYSECNKRLKGAA